MKNRFIIHFQFSGFLLSCCLCNFERFSVNCTRLVYYMFKLLVITCCHNGIYLSIERLRNENEDKTKTQMTQSFNQCSQNETKIWLQNILNQFNRVSSSCLRSHFRNLSNALLITEWLTSRKSNYLIHAICIYFLTLS